MKNTKKTKNNIKELASYFDKDLQATLPVSILPDGGLLYKNFLVKQLKNKNWGVYNLENNDLKNQYYLKSCALMAAKAFHHLQFNRCSEIKSLDDRYWSCYSDTLFFKNNIAKTTDDKYEILLSRLEESNFQSELQKYRIYRLFKCTFS